MRHLDPTWVEFVERCQRVIGTRQKGAPVIMMTLDDLGGDLGFKIHLISFELQPVQLIPIVGHLITSVAEKAPPDLIDECRRLRDLFNTLFSGKVDVVDVTAGLT